MKYLKFFIDKLTEVIQMPVLYRVILKMLFLQKKYDKCNVSQKTIRSDNANKQVFAHLNINSIRNKFEFLATQVKDKIDILISETKIDESFPNGNFIIEGFSNP